MAAKKKKVNVSELRRSELVKMAVKAKKLTAKDDHSTLTKDALVKLLS